MSADFYRRLHASFSRPRPSTNTPPRPDATSSTTTRADAGASFTAVQNVEAVQASGADARDFESTTMKNGWFPPEDELGLAAGAEVPVLITCAMRSERERCARLIHARSKAAAHPFVVCFDGAGVQPVPGQAAANACVGLRRGFEDARGGVLFIDDLAEFTADAQRELASLLEACVGDPRHDAARVIAGASTLLDGARRTGAFDAALFYRLNVIHLRPEEESVTSSSKR